MCVYPENKVGFVTTVLTNIDSAIVKLYHSCTILNMQECFELVTGVFDYTIDNITIVASVAPGASVIEK